MAIVFQSPNTDQYNAVEVTDIDLHANEYTPSTIDFEKESVTSAPKDTNANKSQLRVVDELFGPIKIGTHSITRCALDALGATSNGQRLNGKNTFFRHPRRSFVNSLQFDPSSIEARMRSTGTKDDYTLPSLLFEMATQRPLTAPALISANTDTHADPEQHRHKLGKLLKSAQKLDIRHAHLSKSTPHWVNRIKSSSMVSMGAGLQAFGIYSGLRGLQDAIARKDQGEIVFNSLSISAEVTSLAVEVAVTKQAKYMIEAGQKAYKDFAKTSFGVRLGRGAGLITSALTLPFDVISAVKSFNNAAAATGKESMDHYVSAGLSVTSAAMTLILGAAALAGFSFIGPVGLAAGLLLVAGSQVYAAVRVVDDIDDYIELTTHERLRTGWFAFWGISPDEDIQTRHAIAKSTVEHSRLLQATARKLLEGKLKDTTEIIVNGKFQVELKPTQVTSFDWDAQQYTYKTVPKPYVIDSNDTIDARDGVTADMPGAEFGTPGENKGAVWFIGGGNDTINGIEKKPNRFYYAAGIKHLTGGEKDDEFIFEGAADLLKNGPKDPLPTTLKGGLGNDTLTITGNYPERNKQRFGYVIDLNDGRLSIITHDQTNDSRFNYRHTLLEGIENAETLAGAENKVIGTDGPNIIKSRGRDTIEAGAGDDQIYLLNNHGSASGGPGKDHYAVAHKPGNVFITEDGVDESVIALDWRMDLIKSWKIEKQSLVITSGFDLNDLSERDIYIKGVYKIVNNQRQLQNGKLTFITKDGFHLMPEFPETINTDDPRDIAAVVTQQGIIQNPIILYNGESTIAHDKDKNYCISRINEHTTLRVKQRSTNTLTTVYIDYANHELTRIEAYYNVDLMRQRDFDRILYKECGLTFHFDRKRLTIKNLASSIWSGDQRITSRLTRPDKTLNQHFILIMNDGVSYRVNQPSLPDTAFSNDQFEINGPMERTREVPLPLEARDGKHVYHQPFDNDAHQLGNQEKCVKLISYPEQTAIENLVGDGSTYLVHLGSEMTLRISTPGARANATIKSQSASTWEFDATGLAYTRIKLVDNHLLIGHAVIHLPQYNDPQDLTDQIRVITPNGAIYKVDLDFDEVYIDSLDGRYFKNHLPNEAAIAAEMTSLKMEDIAVRHIAMKDSTVGTLSYNLSKRHWILDSDKSRTVHYADLVPLNRCAHQLQHCYELMESGTTSSPPVSAANLRILLDACKTF
ncbi:calcium-binding protein [Pseudomonas sp. BGI-2]|uniref:calcium-binding protein n=1 Tax=Pseudomonas sp. BGI-2 TaxID=2528211 RepID=UPI001034C4CF|nr:calcium-binding protein [Pseudomonas sp. BGI-2]TBN37193.1 calcium-binding protein [Pseudomonas sp. BGI-2]